MGQISKTIKFKFPKGTKLSTMISGTGGFQSDVSVKDGGSLFLQVNKGLSGGGFTFLYPTSSNNSNQYYAVKDGEITIDVVFTSGGSSSIAPNVKLSKSENALISEEDGSCTGYFYAFTFEDSTDNNYSDLMITMIANNK